MTFGVALYLISALAGVATVIWKRHHPEEGEDPMTGIFAGFGVFLFLPFVLGIPLAVIWRVLGW